MYLYIQKSLMQGIICGLRMGGFRFLLPRAIHAPTGANPWKNDRELSGNQYLPDGVCSNQSSR